MSTHDRQGRETCLTKADRLAKADPADRAGPAESVGRPRALGDWPLEVDPAAEEQRVAQEVTAWAALDPPIKAILIMAATPKGLAEACASAAHLVDLLEGAATHEMAQPSEASEPQACGLPEEE